MNTRNGLIVVELFGQFTLTSSAWRPAPLLVVSPLCNYWVVKILSLSTAWQGQRAFLAYHEGVEECQLTGIRRGRVLTAVSAKLVRNRRALIIPEHVELDDLLILQLLQ